MAEHIAVVGCGTIGTGWVARLLLHGHNVSACDQDPAAENRCWDVLQQATAAVSSLHHDLPDPGKLTFHTHLGAWLDDVDYIIEALPEDLALKQAFFKEAEAIATVPVLSSTSGFKPSALGATLAQPQRLLVCHPFNPVYLLPLVEVVPHPQTTRLLREQTISLLRNLNMRPLLLRHEIDGHIADRLLEAMWREALWLVNDNLATTAEIDDAIKYGFGLRMAHMGLFETYRLGGGEGGFRQFIAQFGPALQWPWSHLTDVPELNDELIDKIVAQSDQQVGAHTTAELIAQRDKKLVAFLKAT